MALVNALAQVLMGKKIIKFYSFATKYCNHHRSSNYPIYDQYVEKILVYFGKLDRFTEFTKPELKRYARFVKIILAFRDHYHLSSFPLRQIDIYLWLGGKKEFSRQYKVA